jgi:acyl carrier protein
MSAEAGELNLQIKKLIIDTLKIPDVTPEEVEDDVPIFQNQKLGLDSIDAVELVVALQRAYGVKIDDQNLARDVLQSVDHIAGFVRDNRRER